MDESDRSRALEWASVSREVRLRLREEMRSGARGLEAVLEDAQSDPFLAQVKLLWTIESLPAVKKVLTRRKLGELGLDETLRIGSLSDAQRSLVLENFGSGDADAIEATDVDATDVDATEAEA